MFKKILFATLMTTISNVSVGGWFDSLKELAGNSKQETAKAEKVISLNNYGPMHLPFNLIEVKAEVKFNPSTQKIYHENTRTTAFNQNDRDKSKWHLVVFSEFKSLRKEINQPWGKVVDNRLQNWVCNVNEHLGQAVDIWVVRMNSKSLFDDTHIKYESSKNRVAEVLSNKDECFDKFLVLKDHTANYTMENEYLGWLGTGNKNHRYPAKLPAAVLVDSNGNIRERFGFTSPLIKSKTFIQRYAAALGVKLDEKVVIQEPKQPLSFWFDVDPSNKAAREIAEAPMKLAKFMSASFNKIKENNEF